LAWRRLLAPAGGLDTAFGLRPSPGRGRAAARATLALVAGGVVIDLVVALVEADRFVPHWTEWFDPDLAFGSSSTIAASLVSGVVVAPVFEEIVFRGLLYGSLRRLGGPSPTMRAWLPAGLASALVFALAHGYGVGGFTSVLLSGLLWTWAYERTRSLLPGIVAHAVNNAIVSVTLLLLLRA
ncbi:MAG TPA: CPBP family intramembrane glutamic endopeptidase, partial [Candidatus Tectomicrobia bacterium]|nr:CPBP family intramembrane glutamic endopeptidase [Candidatus Tectomicrobia bacterium]